MDEEIELGNLSVENHEDISQNSPDATTDHNQVSEDYQDTEDNITVKDIGLMSIFGLVMPSVDQGSDYYKAGELINDVNPCRSRSPEERLGSQATEICSYVTEDIVNQL